MVRRRDPAAARVPAPPPVARAPKGQPRQAGWLAHRERGYVLHRCTMLVVALAPRRTHGLAAALLAVVALAFGCEGGCRGSSTRPFDPAAGYQPLEPCRAPFPEAQGGDPHPETVRTVAGNGDDWDWAHGAGYLHATLAEVWAALANPRVSRIHGPRWEVTGDVEPEYPLSFAIRYTDGNDFITVHWTIAYRGGALSGTLEAPVELGFRYQRVHGTDYVAVQDGSLVASDAGDGVTAVQLVCHLDAYGQGPVNVRGTVTDWFEGLRAAVHGEPVP